ncbi:hypothetical protein, partial [Paenibacillus thiaminolyticus]|uniref:hypothetical protein n=1 Tax=Paenibacillus thiaminolyticus TaxID=49283 RepID=UPI0022830A85
LQAEAKRLKFLPFCRIPFLVKSSISNCCIDAGFCLPNRRVWRNRAVFADFAYRIEVSREMVQFPGRWKTPVFYEWVEIVHFPTHNLDP